MDEHGVLVVVHIAQRLGHAAGEHGVGGVQHLPPGTEILPQQDSCRPGSGLRVCPVFCVEDGGVSQAEAVDGLLHVAHQKQALPPVGDGGEDRVLHETYVLVLVHHHLGIAPGQPPRKLRGRAVLFDQQLRSPVLQIGVIHQPPALLVAGIGVIERKRQTQQLPHCGGSAAHILQHRLRRQGKNLRHVLKAVKTGRPPLFQVFGKLFVRGFHQ